MKELCTAVIKSAKKAIDFFENRLQEDGSYGDKVKDIACYYKSPMMFILSGKPELAKKVLNYAKSHFLQSNGDFLTCTDVKSANGAYTEFWSYTNGWFIRSAQRLSYHSIIDVTTAYLDSFSHTSGGFLTHKPDSGDGVMDILTTAHLGLLNLERGNISRAEEAGRFLCRALDIQPNLGKGIFLRLNKDETIITSFSEKNAPLHIVSKTEPGQLYFMIGYPMAYLGLLYETTAKTEYLDSAKKYLDFALTCHEDIFTSGFSHKVAWAASLLYKHIEKPSYLIAVQRIVKHFIDSQTAEGIWYADDINNAYDQSAEIACWFIEINRNLTAVLEKKTMPSDAMTSAMFKQAIEDKKEDQLPIDDATMSLTFSGKVGGEGK